MKKLFAIVACLAFFGVAPVGAGAGSGTGPPPIPSCFPGVGPCQETDHFGELQIVVTPLPGCATLSGPAQIDTKGNGVQHINVDAAQDFWITMTMVGPTTIVQGGAQFDAMGNYIPGTFVADRTLPTFSGQFQQWFGAEINARNASESATGNFQGTSSTGAVVALHFNFHENLTGTVPPMPNPNSFHFDVSCS